MPLNGSDVASRVPGSTAVPETTIESSKYNAEMNDMIAILNAVRGVPHGATGVATHTAGGVLVGNGVSPVSSDKAAPDGAFVGTTDSQTLSNKTLASPTISGTVTGSGVIASDNIADANVTTAKIADANVTTDKIADSNVTTVKIADANVTTDKIADVNVTTGKVADAAITQAKLADPYVARPVAYAEFDWTGSAINISASSNVSGIVRDSAGKYTITFTTPITGNFTQFVTPRDATACMGFVLAGTGSAIQVGTYNPATGFVDPDAVNAIFFKLT